MELPGYSVRTAKADHPVPTLAYRIDEGIKRGRFDADKAHHLGLRGRDFARLEQGEGVTVAGRTIRPEEVMGPPRPGRSVVFSGDSAPSPEIEKLARRASVLIHESTTTQELEAEANEWGHSSARQAAAIAKQAEVERLYLTHFSSRYKELEPLADEARKMFPNAVAARDLLEELIRQP